MTPTDALRALAEPLLAGTGLELWDVEVSGDVLRFLVDRDGGIDLDALAGATRAVSTVLDGHEELAPSGAYQLEVSSPGVERTLRTPEHYRRFVGSKVAVKTAVAVEGSRRHRGSLVAATDTGCELAPDAAPRARVRFSYDQIERARTVFEWDASSGRGPAGKPGRSVAAGSRGATGARRGGADHRKDTPR